MAIAEYRGENLTDPHGIARFLDNFGIIYEPWGLRDIANRADGEILSIYAMEIDRLKRERGYHSADLVALRPSTPNLDELLAKFAREHHHSDDEVRFTIEGEGVFEVASGRDDGEYLKFTAQPGDLIIVPARRRHRFYLTAKQQIRTIRLFKTAAGWEALYGPGGDA